MAFLAWQKLDCALQQRLRIDAACRMCEFVVMECAYQRIAQIFGALETCTKKATLPTLNFPDEFCLLRVWCHAFLNESEHRLVPARLPVFFVRRRQARTGLGRAI